MFGRTSGGRVVLEAEVGRRRELPRDLREGRGGNECVDEE